VSDLPPLPAGLVRPVELEACAQLEQSGWVAALKAPLSESPVVRRSDSLAVETGVNLAEFDDWAQHLAGLAETVANAIDES
tara:strand:+ start:287 stop:529 length:243 start_codon:yes stop_codon:yes gene_type:complete